MQLFTKVQHNLSYIYTHLYNLLNNILAAFRLATFFFLVTQTVGTSKTILTAIALLDQK